MSVSPDIGEWPIDTLPESWSWASFVDVWSDNTDSTRKLPKKHYSASGQLPVVDQGEELVGGYCDDHSLRSRAPIPSIVWGDHTRCVKYLDQPFVQGADGVKVLTPTNALDPMFGYLALKNIKIPDKGYSRHFKFLRASQFPLPPLPEQRRIVAKLDTLFERTRRAREELSHIPRLIENYKNAILEAAFRGDLTKEWIRRGPATLPVSPRGSAAIKKKYRLTGDASFSPPYAIRDDWRWIRLPELGDLDRGKSKHRPRNDPALFGGDFPFVQTGEVRGADRYLRYFSKTYNTRGLAQSRLWPAGTVCITIAANIAETAILDIDACFPDSVVGFVADENRVSNSYIEFFLRTMKDDLEAFAPATAQKNINLDTLSSVYVPVPPLLEQAEIVRRIEKAMDWLSVVDAEQRQATHLLDNLDEANLAKAFRGELVPQDPNDEPAAVLLEHIRSDRAAQPGRSRGRHEKCTEESVW